MSCSNGGYHRARASPASLGGLLCPLHSGHGPAVVQILFETAELQSFSAWPWPMKRFPMKKTFVALGSSYNEARPAL